MKTNHSLIFIALLLQLATFARAQETIPLYKHDIPNAKKAPDLEQYNKDSSVVSLVSHPTLSIFLPPKNKSTGSGVIVCPGGGYHALVIDREGYDMARRLNRYGIAAFVLKYRLPDARTMVNASICPLQDAQQAIKIVRENAGKWHINPDKIGIMGFSAGGHLASTAGTHFDQAYIEDAGKISLRPDFMILVYPVISMTYAIGPIGSRSSLLGSAPSEEEIRKFSNEMHVNEQTPPAFIVQAGDDSVVKVENSIRFYEALHHYKIPAAMHIYQKGGHGFLKYPPRDVWMKDLIYWLQTNDLLPSK